MIRPSDKGPRGKRPPRAKGGGRKTGKAPSGGSAKGGCRSKAIAIPVIGLALLAFLIFRPA